jgi:ubiquinone/menaquinone biosynthesis C-methylase UbiE
MKSKIQRWKIGFNIDNQEYKGNELLAQKLSKKGYNALISDYVYISPDDVKKTFLHIPEGWESFYGKGIDLGSGVGCISATIAKKEQVKKIYSVELVESVVTLCQPIVINKILDELQRSKVVSVIGDFDNLNIKDSSLDFATCWFSMHHSLNPVVTLKEALRVLKPGGRFIFVDKFHNNDTPDKEIERMLNIVYSEEFLKNNFRPAGIKLTRRENGEHEYRLFEWEKFIKKSGFKIIQEIIIKTDNPENRKVKNDANLPEVFVNYNIGGFGNRAVGFVLEKPL